MTDPKRQWRLLNSMCVCVCTHAFNDKLEEEVINLKRGVSQGEMVTHRKSWG